jgi:hypothetical protein
MAQSQETIRERLPEVFCALTSVLAILLLVRNHLIAFALSLAIAAVGLDIASQQAAWEKAAEARHDALVKRWGKGSDSALRNKLHEMYVRDQNARRFMMSSPPSQWTDSLGKQQQDADASLTLQLKEIVRMKGWPTFRLVGIDGAREAMLILNHSPDHAWQNEMLPQLEILAKNGEIDGSDLAMFVDKTLIAAGKPQRYGMTFKFVDGKMQMYAVEDPAHLAERRERVQLPPLLVYKHMLAEIYHLKETDEIAQPEAAKP